MRHDAAFRFGLIALMLGLGPAATAARGDEASAAASDFFETAIRPVLVARCQSCHGDEKPKSGLSVTTRAALVAGGKNGPAVVPGKPEESLLIEALRHEGDLRMPPKKPLAPAEVAAFTRWVALGAPWPEANAGRPAATTPATSPATNPRATPHWAFQPVRAVPPPAVRDPAWIVNPIDQFILSRLEAEGLKPSPPADRRTLIRRLSNDLTGLPPSPAEVAAFLADDRPDAHERLVERLLASPHHGEQWARHWLDVARYSDTKGYVYAREEARWVHAWAYRDWVVNALNHDLPYDRFVLLQMAADQLATDPADLPAMGFLTLGRRFLGVTHEIIDDRIDVVTRGMLGLTVACARCHDHKYDPIPTNDYYSLYGVFRNVSERVVPATREPAERAGEAFARELATRQTRLAEKLAAGRAEAAERVRARVGDYLLAQFEMQKYPEEGFDQVLAPDDLFPAFVRRWRDAIKRAGERNDPVFRPWHEFLSLPVDAFAPRAAEVARRLLEASPGEVNPRVAQAFAVPPASPRAVAERYARVFQDVIRDWTELRGQALHDGLDPPDRLPDADAEAVRRILYGPDSPCEVPDEPIVDVESYVPTSVCEALWRLQGDVDRWLIQSAESPAYATILVDRPANVDTHVLRRGNPANLGELVPRRFLRVLAGPNAPAFPNGSGRLDLARAIVDPSNPLTARVIVNRVWMHHFGAGLVRTPGDFGLRADPPSHPELLDWLTARFVAEGWSLKTLHRWIVTSATYRQSSTGPADRTLRDLATRRDPDNRWLWRMPAHRLTFEELRDALLSVAGERDDRVGGKAVNLLARPFPTRRTLYGHVDRQDFPSLYRAFDVANPDLLVPQRSETTVPQQALFFLNNAFVIERARALVRRDEIASAPSPEAKVRRLYSLLFQREPTPAQVSAVLAMIEASAAEPLEKPSPTVATWSYGYGRVDESAGAVAGFKPLPYFDGSAWQGGPSWPDARLGWVQLTAEGGHAGNDRAHAAVRRWTAPRDGVYRVRSTLHHDVAAGDGIRGFLLATGRGVLRKAEAHKSSAEFHADGLSLRQGDTLDFAVDIKDNLNNDQFRWATEITLADAPGAPAWNAQADFAGKTVDRLDPWEQLAQVLLMTNEFSFVD